MASTSAGSGACHVLAGRVELRVPRACQPLAPPQGRPPTRASAASNAVRSRNTSALGAAARSSAASAPPSHSSMPPGSRRAMRSMSARGAGPGLGIGQAEHDGGRAAAPGRVDDLVGRQLDAQVGDAHAGQRRQQRRAEDAELVPIARQRRHQQVRPPRRVRHGADDAAEQAAQHRRQQVLLRRSTAGRRATRCRCGASAAAPRRGPGRAAAARRRRGRSRARLRWRRSGAARRGRGRAARRGRAPAPARAAAPRRARGAAAGSAGSAAPGTGFGVSSSAVRAASSRRASRPTAWPRDDRRRHQLQPPHVGVAVDAAALVAAPASPRGGAAPRRAACRR